MSPTKAHCKQTQAKFVHQVLELDLGSEKLEDGYQVSYDLGSLAETY